MSDNIQLELKNVTTIYGKNKMLHDISVQIPTGQCACLLGSNGSGKSTLIKAILGLTTIVEGKIFFEGRDITGQKTYKAVREGISIVPEGKRIFRKMNVLENLRMGAYTEEDKDEIELRYEKVFKQFPLLKERLKQIAGTLSGGEQSMLAIGRGLMCAPKLMIFDEPSLGLAPVLVQRTFEIIKEINESGVTVFLVEQNAHMSLSISDLGYFLQKGQIIASGTTAELQDSDVIRNAYFG
ncbi:MAG: ABC transporter ATP-binding protein [Deltaproteobacteria bacterium]|nr:ABC transporter ATP-binding protein [Deltaproteobacteria bacterium]